MFTLFLVVGGPSFLLLRNSRVPVVCLVMSSYPASFGPTARVIMRVILFLGSTSADGFFISIVAFVLIFLIFPLLALVTVLAVVDLMVFSILVKVLLDFWVL